MGTRRKPSSSSSWGGGSQQHCDCQPGFGWAGLAGTPKHPSPKLRFTRLLTRRPSLWVETPGCSLEEANRSHPWPLTSRSAQSSGPKAFGDAWAPAGRLSWPSAVKVTIRRGRLWARLHSHLFSQKAWFLRYQTPLPLISSGGTQFLLFGSIWSKEETDLQANAGG